MLTETHKQIYNWYISAQRRNNDKPFRYRRDFSKFNEEKYLPSLIKIEKTFEKYPHLRRQEFFDAPFQVHTKEKDQYYSLESYATQKALMTCIAYFKLLDQQKPDEQLEYIKESLRFVTNFCIEHKLFLYQYVQYKSVAQNDCLKHLKNHQISWYLVLVLPGFLSLIQAMPLDEFSLYFGEEIDINHLITAWAGSRVTRQFLEKKVREIDQFLIQKNLENNRITK